jgi:hypothetical protein
MTALDWLDILARAVAFLLGWTLVSFVVALILGRAISHADRHGDSEQGEGNPLGKRSGQGFTIHHTIGDTDARS